MTATTTHSDGGEVWVEFGPLEQRGVLLGISPASMTVMAAGTAAALTALLGVGGGPGLLGAVAALALAGLVAFLPVAGAPAAEWLGLLLGHTGRTLTGRRSWRSATPTAGLRRDAAGAGAAPVGVDLPAPLARAGTRIVAARWLDTSVGVLLDGPLAVGVLRARAAGAFLLREPGEQHAATASWAEVLAALADPGSPWVRLQWRDATTPVDAGALVAFLADAATPAARTPGTAENAARLAYERLARRCAPAAEAHEVLIAAALDPRRATQAVRDAQTGHRRKDRDAAVAAVTTRQLERLAYTLAGADVRVDGALTPRQLAQVLREQADPSERAEQSDIRATLTRPPDGRDDGSTRDLATGHDADGLLGCDPVVGAWPLSADEGFTTLRTDGAHHATLWVREWPRRPARLDFLAPLLVRTGSVTRVVSVVMAPVDPATALRQAEDAATADESDDTLRARFGIRTSGRRKREALAATRREEKLLDGFDDVRFAGYVTVSAPTRDALEQAVRDVQAQARAARLRLTRLAGQQAEAFWYTAPLCRGLK